MEEEEEEVGWKEGRKKLWHVFPFPINFGRTFALRRGGEGKKQYAMLQLNDTATIVAQQHFLSNTYLFFLYHCLSDLDFRHLGFRMTICS